MEEFVTGTDPGNGVFLIIIGVDVILSDVCFINARHVDSVICKLIIQYVQWNLA